MRYNRIITTVCIFLLQLSRVLVGALIVFLLGSALFGKLLIPLSFNLGDDYRLEESLERSLEVEYLGVQYNEVSIWPTSFYLDLDSLPISGFYMFLPMILLLGAAFYMIQMLIGFLKSIEKKEFFSMKNIKRLRVIGFTFITFSIVAFFRGYLIRYFLIDYLEIEGLVYIGSKLSVNLSFLSPPLFLGLITLLIANAFEHGLKLREEQELTI